MRGHLGEVVHEDGVLLIDRALHLAHGLFDLGVALLVMAALLLLAPEPAFLKVELEPYERVPGDPCLDIILLAVLSRVVGGGVRAQAVGEGLDERGT